LGELLPLKGMETSHAENHIGEFVVELLQTGSMLARLVADLVEALPPDAYPGEDPAAVIVEMLWGTIDSALGAVDPQDVRRATELIELAAARVLEHLRLARALSRRVHGADGGIGGSDG
jgi:hypothetical protein